MLAGPFSFRWLGWRVSVGGTVTFGRGGLVTPATELVGASVGGGGDAVRGGLVAPSTEPEGVGATGGAGASKKQLTVHVTVRLVPALAFESSVQAMPVWIVRAAPAASEKAAPGASAMTENGAVSAGLSAMLSVMVAAATFWTVNTNGALDAEEPRIAGTV